MTKAPSPLHKVRVLDLTNVLAGPFCCHQLGALGAEVIKVEIPGSGDLARQLGGDPDLNEKLMGVSFLAQNSGKRSMTINLKSAKGVAVFKKLVATADVVVENFRPGVMARLGVGYDELSAINPQIVYCAISGFGQEGPLRDLPAYDQIIQGMSGVMDITGAKSTAPYRVGYPMADTIGGLTAAFAISAALANRSQTRGAFIDISMLESVLATMGWAVSDYLVADKAPTAMGNENVTASPSGTFQTSAGLVNIAANKQEQFEATCKVLQRPELIDDERFCGRQERLRNRQALSALLEKAMASKPASHWCALFNQAGVPAGEVMSVPDILAHPQIAERGMIATFTQVPGIDREIKLARTGIKLNGESPKTQGPPPLLGAHTDDILAELGISDKEIERLRMEKAI